MPSLVIDSVRGGLLIERVAVTCRYPPTVSGPHSLNRYAKGHALHDADVNMEGRPTAV